MITTTLAIKPQVAVIMSTYNGEKYLSEQINSILNQKNVTVSLFVRDDGSSDATQEILDLFASTYGNIYLMYGENLGVGNSFMKCLYDIEHDFDFYAFSDQDDIWMENKLYEAICLLEKHGKSLYCSNQICVDSDGIFLGKRFESEPGYGVLDCLNNNQISGCTFVFSGDFYKILKMHRPSEELLKNRIHDVWVAEIAALGNLTVYDERAFILYRQHAGNAVGAYIDNSFRGKLKRKIGKIRNKNKRNGRSKLAREIYRLFPEYRENEIIKYASFANTWRGKIDLLKHRNIFLKNQSGGGIFILYVIAGLF